METIASGLEIMKCSSCALRLGKNSDYADFRRRSLWSRLTVTVLILALILSCSVHESSTESANVETTYRNLSVSNADFINGLAGSVRKISSTQLEASSRNAPFLLQYRTACRSSNLIYNEKFSIHIDSDGNLSYTNKESNETQIYGNVADGHWHSLIFNGSTISIANDDHHITEEDENALTKDSTILVSYSLLNSNEESVNSNSNTNENSQHHDLLYFFDGFVGCVRVLEHSSSSSSSSSLSSSSSSSHHIHSGHGEETNGEDFEDDFGEFSQNSDGHSGNGQQLHDLNATASSMFQLFNTFPGCTDVSLDLRNSHHCHIPDTFIYCEKCQGKCVEKTGDQHIKYNLCNCSNLNTRGRYCETPIPEIKEPGRARTNEFREPDSESASTNNSNNDSNPVNTTRTSSSIIGKSGSVSNNYSSINSSSVVSNDGVGVSPASSSVTTSIPVVVPAPTPVPSPPVPVVPCPCQNGGICLNNQCYCTPGFTGENCEVDIDECNPMKCRANSTVQCLNLINKFTCVCVPGFTSKLCDENIDECESNPCQNGATCVDEINNYTCSCLPGYTGMNCEIDIDECADDGEAKCLNSGACIDKINGFDCNCTGTGFEGPKCENNVDDCSPDACQHGSTCIDEIKGYKCDCFPGYTGYNCETDVKDCEIIDTSKGHEGTPGAIATSPCHEGTCHEYSNQSLYSPSAWENNMIPNEFKREFAYANASGYYCQCPPGFQGTQCEINLNECELPDGKSPCIHGKCVDGRNNYTCNCDAGYTGRNCQEDIDECLSNPCVRGECIDKIADFTCTCPEGYGSKNCSVKLTACEEAPCLNQGSCRPFYENNEQRFDCTCQPGFSGQICSVVTTMSFNGSNYVTVSSNDDNYRSAKYELQFRFKTTLSNVLVAVGQGITYFMLTLSDGRLNLQSSLLNSLNGISSGTNLSNAEWHKVWISVNDTHIALAANFEQTIHPISENQETPGDTGFNMTVLGGATPTLNSLNKENLGFFVGCVQDVVINGQSVNAEEKNANITLVQGVQRGCPRKEQCKPTNPCLNGGVCTDLWQKYQCHCTRPYLGSRCEFHYKPGTFGNERTTTSIAEVHISPEVSRKFSNSFDISMFVRTRESRGTIFFLGDESRENGLFLEAQVEEDGQLGVVSKLDNLLKEETYTVGGLQINDGIPHLINVQKEKGLVKISINGTEHFRKSVKEKIIFNPTILYVGGFLPNGSDFSIDSSDFEDSTVIPGVEIPMTRAPPTVSSQLARKMKPFKGVIQDVRVNLSSTDVAPTAASHDHFVVEFFPVQVPSDYSMGQSLGNVTLHGEVLEGIVSDETCVSNPCLNDGVCEVTWNDFQCHCTEGVYDGKTCEEKLRCAMVTCPDNSVCSNIGAVGFECVAEAAFDGRKNVSPHYHLKSQQTDHLTFQKVSFRYRSRTGGSVIYLANRNSSVRISLELEYEESARDGGPMVAANSTEFVSVYLNGGRHPIKVENALDGDWHTIDLEFDMDSHLIMKFDSYHHKGRVAKDSVISSNLFNDIVLSHDAQIIVGSYVRDGSQYEVYSGESPTGTSSGIVGTGTGNSRQALTNHPETLHDSFFRGCLADVKIGNYELPFVSPDQLYALNENRSLVEVTAPTAFYIDYSQSPPQTPVLGCILCYDSECKNGGICENASNTYDCKCNSGFDGRVCERNIDECMDNHCASGSTCVDLIANYTCECPGGYTGWLCDTDLDECSNEINGKFISPCKNGGQCINLAAEDGFYKCICDPDYNGANCEKRKLSTCQNNNEPCENNSTCKPIPMRADGLSFVCECQSGYEGLVCDKKIDYCKSVTCANGGTCHNIEVGFRCSCVPGWDGPKCEEEINECAFGFEEGDTSPCKHGTCIDGLNQFTCDCTGTGYTGENCEIDIDECADMETRLKCSEIVPKECVNFPGGYKCECPRDFCGQYCNISNPCEQAAQSNQTCHNDGECQPLCDTDPYLATYQCVCKPEYRGNTCELLTSKKDQTLSIALIVIPVLTAFLLAVVIAIFVLVKMARKKRATRGVYSPSQQEYCNPRVELDNVLKPPPEERLI